MADKQASLSIVLKTVDNATAGLRAFKQRVDSITAPVRQLGDGIRGLARDAGLPRIVDGFKGVGGALSDLRGKLLGIAAVAAGAVIGVKSLVDKFDDLGDKAERFGVHVDFLAELRHAAEKSGASVEDLDAGLQSFITNLGAAQAGKGSLFKFLSTVAPDLRDQLKATKSGEEAFLLMADAISKVTDQERKLSLAEKTGLGASLVPLMSKGSKGVAELMEEHFKLAGSQQAAADGAGKVDDGLKNLNASVDGVKAALLTGLSPALTEIVDKLSQWFVDHREDVEKWATKVGQELPGAVEKIATAVKDAVKEVGKFIDQIGGLGVAAGIAAAVMAGPLVLSIAKVGLAFVTTPFGIIATAIAGVVTGVVLLIENFDKLVDAARAVKDAIGDFVKPQVADFAINLQRRIEDPNGFNPFAPKGPTREIPGETLNAAASVGQPTLEDIARAMAAARPTESRVKVDFANAPRGTRVTADPQSTDNVDLSVGYQLGAGL